MGSSPLVSTKNKTEPFGLGFIFAETQGAMNPTAMGGYGLRWVICEMH